MKAEYFFGLDFGKTHDFTALVVLERAELQGAWDPVAFGFRTVTVLRLRYVKRFPLGTEYVEIVQRVKEMMGSRALNGPRHLVVDATGLGSPIVELLRRAEMGCRLWPVSITGGDKDSFADGLYRVPKRDLVVGLQVLFEQGALQIAEGLSERAALVKEMSDMRVKVTSGGHEQYEAGKSGQHDDLVSALSLACWAVSKRWRGGGVGFRSDRRLV